MPDYRSMTEEELDALLAEDTTTVNDLLKDAGGYLKKNLDLPAGIGGALAGAAAGSVVPVVGTIAGGILGGALGTGLGSAASDVLEDGEVDVMDVVGSVGTSLAIDAATLGLGKIVSPIARSLGMTPQSLLNAGKKKGLQLADELLDINKVQGGTLDSIRITQQFLESEGGSLSAAQTGQASAWRRLFEGIGDIGLVSGRTARARVAQNNKIILDSVDELSARAGDNLYTADSIGEELFGIIETGKQAATKLYGDGLDNIIKETGNARINIGQIKGALVAFKKKYNSPLGTSLTKSVQDQADRLIMDLTNSPEVATLLNKNVKEATVGQIIAFQKRVGSLIDEAMPNSATANPVAARQLTELSQMIKGGVYRSLKNHSPNVAATYKTMNKAYGKTTQGLLPKINSRFATAAKNEDYHAIGNMLLSNKNNSKITAMMKSVDTAYEAAAKAGIKPQEGVAKTAVAAKKKIKEAYMQNVFASLTRSTDPTTFGKFASDALKSDNAKKSLTILGAEDFGRYKMLMNTLIDNAQGAESTMFGLAFRQRETAGVAGLLGAGGAGAAMSSVPLLAGVLLLPEVMGRMATSPAAVNKLLSLNQNITKFTDPKALAIAVDDIVKLAIPDEEERKQLGADIETGY
mgnify:CR=1 FL=1|tara:strand:+ start:2407 stop:4311 length:1905 start_codon:yes stop_codon:yes gene_type:complete